MWFPVLYFLKLLMFNYNILSKILFKSIVLFYFSNSVTFFTLDIQKTCINVIVWYVSDSDSLML